MDARSFKRGATIAAAAILAAGLAGREGAIAQEDEPVSCGTHQRWVASGSPSSELALDSLGCQKNGSCDNAGTRDQHIPSSSAPVTTVTLQINVFCNDAGTSCRATQTLVNNALTFLNIDFADLNHQGVDSRIRFISFVRFINDSRFMTLTNFNFPDPDDFLMKDLYARSPKTLLNVYVTDMSPSVTGLRGLSTYPWDPLALQPRGGIVVDFREFGLGRAILTHEIGHALGLFHTHRGGTTAEGESQCNPCWENQHQLTSLAADQVGDFCRDTFATDPTFCATSGLINPCNLNGGAWTSLGFDFENFMGFGALNGPCRDHFTSQQLGRMHCWMRDRTPGWISGESDTCSGAGTILPGRNFGTTFSATSTIPEVESRCDNGTDDLPDVWYRYVSAAGGPVTLSMCGTSTSFDSQVSVHTDCGAPFLNEVGCSEDHPNCGAFGAQARMTFQAVAGQPYFIRVTSDDAARGDFELLLCETGSSGCEPPKFLRAGTPSPGGTVTVP
ncbi:MAG TPA: M43 family zinc metalloprotease [Verrucomicrobiae bacterium]|nr:M43 family zinc metalloprotease [Verrucomicrobiae bacterium]